MNNEISNATRFLLAPRLSIGAAAISLLSLLSLHFLSPEFDPSWRMVSEYALGQYGIVLSVFFLSWGVSSWCAAISLWPFMKSIIGKIGILLLIVSGIGEAMASLFDVNHSLHGTSATLGVPTLPIAAILISVTFVRANKTQRRGLLLSAHLTWISLVLLVVAMVVMISGLMKTGNFHPETKEVPKSIPPGVIALAGYTNRLLILAYVAWLIVVSGQVIRLQKK